LNQAKDNFNHTSCSCSCFFQKYVYQTSTINTLFGQTSTVSYWLPQGYKFTSMTVKNIWDSWIHGNIADKIPPLWYLMVGNERECLERSQSQNFSKIKYIMDVLLKEATRLKLPGLLELTERPAESNSVFQQCFCSVMKYEPTSKKRVGELSYKTVYNTMIEADPDRRKKRRANPAADVE
jgi:hypothetical protein